jgi:hypothetical protein
MSLVQKKIFRNNVARAILDKSYNEKIKVKKQRLVDMRHGKLSTSMFFINLLRQNKERPSKHN